MCLNYLSFVCTVYAYISALSSSCIFWEPFFKLNTTPPPKPKTLKPQAPNPNGTLKPPTLNPLNSKVSKACGIPLFHVLQDPAREEVWQREGGSTELGRFISNSAKLRRTLRSGSAMQSIVNRIIVLTPRTAFRPAAGGKSWA